LFDKLSQFWRRLLFYLRLDQFDREFVLREPPLKRDEKKADQCFSPIILRLREDGKKIG